MLKNIKLDAHRSARGAGWVLVAMFVATAAPAAARTLSFPEALDLALASSPRLRESEAKTAAARAARRAARGAGLPRLSLSITGARSDNPLTVFGSRLSERNATFADFGADQFTGPASLDIAPERLNEPGAANNFNTRLQLDVPLYTGGRVTAQVERAARLAAAARLGDIAARQALTYEVLSAYEGLRAARAELGVANAAQHAAAAVIKTTTRLFEQGATLKSDLLTARVNGAEAQLRKQAAANSASEALERLRVLTNLPTGESVRLGPPVRPAMPAGTPDALVALALADNPGVRALKRQVEASSASVTAARAAYLPSFNLVLRHEWNDPTFGLAAPSNTIAGVMSWDLFDFGVRNGDFDHAQAEKDAAGARLAQARDNLRLQIMRAWRAARLAAARVTVSASAVGEAAEAQRIVRLRYTQGVATLSDTLAGQARLDHARGELVSAKYRERLARAALLLALGELDLQHLSAITVAPKGALKQ